MANVSDLIEQFILSVIGDEDTVKLSRNELANYFCVSPSQINYVLQTRFNFDKGFVIESKRGGGGFITVVKLDAAENFLSDLIAELEQIDDLTFNRSSNMVDRLVSEGVVNAAEANIIKSSLSDKALALPMKTSSLRKNVLKEILIGLLRR
ncbi:MAG: CtsR family transcriptional regulator [Clostridia bacterium]